MKVPTDKVIEVQQEYYKLPPERKRCLSCHAKLPDYVEDAWEKDPEYAWLYVECRKCGYQNALWKLFQLKWI